MSTMGRTKRLRARREPVSSLVLVLVLGTAASGRGSEPPATASSWRAFSGTWSAFGRRSTVAVEGGRTASVVEISGAVALAAGDGLGRGFRGQAIGLDDGEGLSTARCVWTDETGDQLFSRIEGDALQRGRRFHGTITGGTGRYEGAEGEYSFTWQYVVPMEDGSIQGRAVGLTGRVRRGVGPR
jgi:hypothetical protein